MAISLTCPSCGNIINQVTRSPQMVVCPACNSTHLLTNGKMEDVGKSAILTDVPSIFEMYKTYKYTDWKFTPVGRVRYDYGDGYWDEWFVRSDNGKETWVSVDEGDIAIEHLVQKQLSLPTFDEIKVGGALMINRIRMTVVEKNTATMVGAQGEVPFKIVPNETYNYIDLLGPKRTAFTIEYQDGGIDCYKGIWVDPFEIVEV
ncbi:MAG: hypothetical protein PWR01_2261 [Clostridiales bacterium]|jgi:hypothetical protein|nr:hypothetical protein [Clostridiales bacterium]MDN5281188.1 hypothetical protein [Candidatus Ozemobacter sp.]